MTPEQCLAMAVVGQAAKDLRSKNLVRRRSAATDILLGRLIPWIEDAGLEGLALRALDDRMRALAYASTHVPVDARRVRFIPGTAVIATSSAPPRRSLVRPKGR